MSVNLTWKLEDIYKDSKSIQDDVKKVEELLSNLQALKENSKENLVKIIKIDAELDRVLSKLHAYSHMKKDEDSNIAESQKLDAKVVNLCNQVASEFAFLKPLLLSLDNNEVQELKNNDELSEYDIYLDRVFRYKAHTLSDKEEQVLSNLSSSRQTPSNTYYYLTNTDIEFPYLDKYDLQIENSNFVKFQTDDNRELREDVFKAFYNTYNKFGNTISQLYYSHIDNLAKVAKMKNYDSVRNMFLFKDNVSEDVYDALIESVGNNLEYLQKYYSIKEKVLGLDRQHMYDVYMPISSEFEKTYTFEEAKELVLESVKPLGEEYTENMKKAFDERWIDVEPRKGKRGGAYSSGSYDTNPYILMNFDGTLNSVFTLAHEIGHSMHSYYDRGTNDFLHSGYTIFVAEVASTFNEALLLNHLIENTESKEEQLYLTDFYLNSFKSTVFRQTMFAEFERDVHVKIENGEVLTRDDFTKVYYDLNIKYFGESIELDEEIGYEWMRIPHFYSNFYVYKYATGFAASAILARRVLEKEDGALEKYLEFLKDGNKHFPIDQLKIAGIDMSKPETVNEALELFASLVNNLEELTK